MFSWGVHIRRLKGCPPKMRAVPRQHLLDRQQAPRTFLPTPACVRGWVRPGWSVKQSQRHLPAMRSKRIPSGDPQMEIPRVWAVQKRRGRNPVAHVAQRPRHQRNVGRVPRRCICRSRCRWLGMQWRLPMELRLPAVHGRRRHASRGSEHKCH